MDTYALFQTIQFVLIAVTALLVLSLHINVEPKSSRSSATSSSTKKQRWSIHNDRVYLHLEDGRKVSLESSFNYSVLCQVFDGESDEYGVIECSVREVSGHYVRLTTEAKNSRYNGWLHVEDARIVQVKAQ